MTAGKKHKPIGSESNHQENEPILLINIDELMLEPVEENPAETLHNDQHDGFISFGDDESKTDFKEDDEQSFIDLNDDELEAELSGDDEQGFVSLNDVDELEIDEEIIPVPAVNRKKDRAEPPKSPVSFSDLPPTVKPLTAAISQADESDIDVTDQTQRQQVSVLPEVSDLSAAEQITTKDKPAKRKRRFYAKFVLLIVTLILTVFMTIGFISLLVTVPNLSGLIQQLFTKEKVPQEVPQTINQIKLETIIEPDKIPFDMALHQLQTLIMSIEEQRRSIDQLYTFYHSRVEQETGNLMRFFKEQNISRYEQAVSYKSVFPDKADNSALNIELRLLVIASRRHYLNELKRLSDQLVLAREQLLYIQRKAEMERLFLGLFADLHESEIIAGMEAAMKQFHDLPRQLTMVDFSPANVRLITVFESILRETRQEKSAARNNADVEYEICQGQYESAILLTRLTPKTAECLINWEAKILNLGSLSQLSPESAAKLAQWQGDWLILNGLSEIGSQTAKALAGWQGSVLSLNGLSSLSETVLNNLLEWKGQQLEISGLQSLGKNISEYQARKMINKMAQWETQGRTIELSDALRSYINHLLTKRSGLG